ncbi:MAG: SMP-30/gluconolactonase/LRE family protein [Bacteroidota bacterium]
MKSIRYASAFLGLLSFAACNTETQEKEPDAEMPEEKPEVFVVSDQADQLGEGAFWYAQAKEFWWIDIEGKRLYTLDKQGTKTGFDMPSRIGTVVPDSDGKAIVAIEEGVYRFDRGDESFAPIAHPQEGMEGLRYNDGKADPQGRLWVGGMHLEQTPGAASLYRIDPDGNASAWRDGITISNGLCWSADHQTMYYIDTPTGEVRAFGYDDAGGSIDSGRVVVTIPESLGFPDGMVIDAEGMLWIALWNGNSVTRWNPNTGEMIGQIFLPAHNVTSCAFVGDQLDTLYITTSSLDMTDAEQSQYPKAGAVFGVVPGVKGAPMDLFGLAGE